MKRLALFLLFSVLSAFAGTLTGQLALPNTSLPLKNGTLTFTLSQSTYVSGSFVVVPSSVNCYSDAFGNVVGLPDPLILPTVTADTTTGSLPNATYFVVYAYRSATNLETFYSPERQVTLSGAGRLIVTVPALQPAGATWDVFIGTASGAETLQASGLSFGAGNFTQSTPLANGAALPASNSTICSLRFTDEMIPSNYRKIKNDFLMQDVDQCNLASAAPAADSRPY